MADALAAEDVRRRLWDALAPVQALCEAFLFGQPAAAARLRFVVQLHPLRVQLVLAQDEGRPAWQLAVFEGSRLPDGGAALASAAEAIAAGVLAALPEKAAEATVLNAAAIPNGGLFVMADPNDEAAVLALAGPGGSLGAATVLGALMDAPETVH